MTTRDDSGEQGGGNAHSETSNTPPHITEVKPAGLGMVWGQACGLATDFIADGRRSLRSTGNSFQRVAAVLTSFLAQLSLAIFIQRTLKTMPSVFDAFSQAIPYAVGFFCFSVSMLMDAVMRPSAATRLKPNRSLPVFFPRLSRGLLRLRLSIARYRLILATGFAVLSLLFGTILIFYFHAVYIVVPQDTGPEPILLPWPTPPRLLAWRDAYANAGKDPLSEIATFDFVELKDWLRYGGRSGVAMTKTILALLYTAITLSITLTFTLMFRRNDRVEELIEQLIDGA
ncbi:MAG: hypothetical protein ACF8MJ_09740 [Phycisphaerales bacterium JB050]